MESVNSQHVHALSVTSGSSAAAVELSASFPVFASSSGVPEPSSSAQPVNQNLRNSRCLAAAFRQQVIEASPQQRQTSPEALLRNGMSRPVTSILYDRQCRGARCVFWQPICMAYVVPWAGDEDGESQMEMGSDNASDSRNPVYGKNKKNDEEEDFYDKRVKKNKGKEDAAGRRSPSTVFDTASLSPRVGAAITVTRNESLRQQRHPQPVDDDLQDDEQEHDKSGHRHPLEDLHLTEPATSQNPSTKHRATRLNSSSSSSESSEFVKKHRNQLNTTLTSLSGVEISGDIAPRLQRGPPAGIPIYVELLYFVEFVSSINYHSSFFHHLGGNDSLDENGNLRPLSSRAVSTISIAFGHDGRTMASTHGDHSVKISCCLTGRLLRSLDGHSRTPWTVKYHPLRSDIVASGCLGHQVRVWNWIQTVCLHMVRLEYAIISLAFHPSGKVLAVANGTRLHFWGVHLNDPQADSRSAALSRHLSSNAVSTSTSSNAPAVTTTALLEVNQGHMLRCVHFPPDGRTLIIGGVNAPTDDPRRRTRPGIGAGVGSMSFYLRLWEFHLETCIRLPSKNSPYAGAGIHNNPISNPRILVPRALLYNDGGFDVSPDGKVLCACVEYWLPEGVDNAMELVAKEEYLYAEKEMQSDRHLAKQNNMRLRQIVLGKTSENSPKKRKETVSDDPAIDPTSPAQPTCNTPKPIFARGISPAPTYLESAPRTPEPSGALSTPRANIADVVVLRLSPPPPPGRRLIPNTGTVGPSVHSPPPLPPGSNSSNAGTAADLRPPHPLSAVTATNHPETRRGRYVPHVVTLSLDSSPLPDSILARIDRHHGMSNPSNSPLPPPILFPAVAVGYRPRLGQLLQACPLDSGKATAVTCVKFSPSCHFCLIGYGVREPVVENNANSGGNAQHPVTAIYRVHGYQQQHNDGEYESRLHLNEEMCQISTMLSRNDDVNIARFHPTPGHGFVYGTKQGRVRVASTRPWMFYNEKLPEEEENNSRQG